MSELGFLEEGQNSFFDVRVTNANCASQTNSSLKSILKKHETEKKRSYNQRVMEVEQGSFTPLVFTVSGSMAPECNIYHKHSQRSSQLNLENATAISSAT